MSRNAIGCILTVCLFCGLANSASTAIQPQIDEDEYIPSSHSGLRDDFDWQLLQELSKTSKGNTIISPISLKLILALLYEGAGGITENELHDVLQFKNQSEVRQEYSNILLSLTNGKRPSCVNQNTNQYQARAAIKTARAQIPTPQQQYTLNLGTQIYLDQNVHAIQAFEVKACEKYQTRIVSANFSNPDKTSMTINNYVNRITQGKISKLTDPGDVTNAVMLLVNALYFRGYWSHQFPKEKSHIGGFYLAPGQAVQVPFMATTEWYYYVESETLDSKIIRIPFKGKKFSMIIILPNAKAGLNYLLERINVIKLQQEVNYMDKRNVDLVLPKFKFDFKARMSDTLKKMGLRAMFDSSASLPGIVRGGEFKLQVSDVIQKAGIEVNEEGSTAFAASDIQLTNKFGDAQVMFNATHPFLFYIEDNNARTILFLGKVINPQDGVAPIAPAQLPPRYGDGEIPQPVATQATKPAAAVFPDQQQYSPLPQQQYGGAVDQQFQLPQAPGDESVAKRFNYFDLELLAALSQQSPNENIFVSPASIKATLGMILESAKGKSASEIANLLRIPLEQQYVRDQLKQLLYDISEQNGYTQLVSANGIFISDKLKVKNQFQQVMQQFYKALISPLNYDNVPQSVNTINQWVASTTRGLIPTIVGPENINRDASVLLTNAMYFKSSWKYAFDPAATTVKCFTLSNGQCMHVNMMQRTADLRYKMLSEINAHAIEIPYTDDYAMLVLLPQVKHSTSAMLLDLQHVTFNTIVDKLEKTEITYEIPKFDIDFNVQLKNILQKLEIREIFGENADLSNMVQNERVRIDNIVHKTKIEVNEQGTIAAAATTAVVIPLMGSSSPHVIANHPFVFFIYKMSNRNIVFEGVVNHPKEATPTAPVPITPVQRVATATRFNAPRQQRKLFAAQQQAAYNQFYY
ncbi:uncharacterized protein [Atheta coriaria]|uniref:uncharacterized protein n=1 Tax=Dalotia coriaria TaxID=877792 RepID=UPI0031F36A0B